jgi:WD40 repeat protein/tetratricopeptide (TPR) repeat protein
LIDGERTLVTISGKSELTRWDLATGKPLPPAPLHVKPWGLQKVVASPDGKWFATGGYYGPEVHAADSNRTSLHLSHTNLARNFAFSPDSTLLLSVSWDQTARLWSLPDGQPVGEPLAHMGTVEHCAWSTDARQVATAQADGLIRIWQRPVEKLVVARLDNWGHRPRLSFDGRLVAQGYWHEVSIRFENQRVNRLRVLGASDGKPAGADIPLPGMLVDSCICGDNRTVAAVWSRGETGQLGVWEVASSRPLFEPITLPGLPSSVAARPASGQLAVLCSTGDLLVIDSHTGKTLLSLRHEGWAADNPHRARVEYTADGKTLVSLGDGGNSTLNVWDANTGQLRFPPVRPVLENGAICRGFALSADSKLLATIVNSQNAAQVWDLATGRPLSQPLPHPGDHFGLFSVSFSPDGRHLITGSKDGQVRYWDWQAGKLACPPLVHADEVYDVLITADGRYALTTVRGQQLLQVWELTSGRRMAPPVRLDSQPGVSTQTLALTPDGRRVLVGFRPGDLAVVDLEALLSPPTTPAKNLALWAELATAQRIEVGDLSGLTKEQWLGRWNTLRANTQLVRSSVTGTWLTTALDAWRRQAAAAAQARGNEYARRGQWSQAAKEALAEVAAHPENRLLWSKAAPRLILAGEVEGPQGYRQLCQRMIEQFHSTTSDEQADSLCKVCLLLPDSADRAKLPSRVLLDAVEGEIAKPYYRSWFYACLGLIAYRDGKFQQAADHTARSLAINNRRGPDGALALLVQAMAQQQLKQADLARQTLAEATALIPEELATLGSPEFKGSLPVNSNVVGSDWLIAEVLRREAALLIHNDASRLLDAATLRSRGLQLYQQGKLDEALAALQKANELEKRHAWAHNLVGMIHLRQGQVDQAMAEFRQAIDFAPDYPPPYINLGVTLSNQGKLQEASTLLQQAIAQDATIAVTQRLLGVTLLRQGKLEEAATHLSKALELDGQDARTIQMHAEVTRLRALLPKLDQYVQGTLKPSDADQRLDLARLCFYRQRFAASARFYADTLSDPKGTGEPKPGQRYNAACAAARASQGAGDAASLDAAQRSHWRKQAIAWLRAELDAATRDLARSTAAERFWVLRRLQIWKVDADLASLRDADQIRKLPKDEQMLLATLWSDLDNALKGTP